jgi:phage-related protein
MNFKDSLYLNYDGISSRDFGIVQISTQSGLFEEMVGVNRSLMEERVDGNDFSYTFGFKTDPREFDLELYFEDGFDDESLNKVIRWLYKNYYKPLFFEDKPHYVSYCTPVGQPRLSHNGNGEGYYVVPMRTNSAHIFSPVSRSDVFDCSANETIQYVEFMNIGNFDIKPDLYIHKIGDGDFEIINLSNQGYSSKFTGLADRETVYIDNYHEIIETDLTQTHRAENFNHEYLTLIAGLNRLAIVGKGSFYFEYQFVY